jgi:hypothetical protein
MTHTPDGASAPAPSTHRRRFNFEPRPIDPALRKRRIKIARAFNLICRTKCAVAVALRATGLDHDHNAREDVCSLLDLRRIPRRRNGVRRVRVPETPSRVFEEFIPRQDSTYANHGSHLPLSRRALAEMVAELHEIGDLLDVPRPPKPKVICACIVCRTLFESKRKSRYCCDACRIKHWRDEQ